MCISMFNRPYLYDSSYYKQPPFYQKGFIPNNQMSYLPYKTNSHPQGPGPYPITPFEHFAKPKQPMNWQTQQPPSAPSNNMQSMNNFKAYFQDENGQMDYDKMFNTVGQLAKTVQQVSPVIQQFGSMIKNSK